MFFFPEKQRLKTEKTEEPGFLIHYAESFSISPIFQGNNK